MVDLIPKQERKPLFGQWFLLIGSLLLFIGVGAGYFVFSQLEGSTQEILKTLDKRLAENTQPEERELTAEIIKAKEKVERFRLAASQRKDVLPVFAFLEQTIVKGVVLDVLEASRTSKQVFITGVADTFFVLEQQRLLWKQNIEVQNIDIKSMRLNEVGNILFEVELFL